VDTNLQTRGRSPLIINGKNVTKEKKTKTKSAGKAAGWVSVSWLNNKAAATNNIKLTISVLFSLIIHPIRRKSLFGFRLAQKNNHVNVGFSGVPLFFLPSFARLHSF